LYNETFSCFYCFAISHYVDVSTKRAFPWRTREIQAEAITCGSLYLRISTTLLFSSRRSHCQGQTDASYSRDQRTVPRWSRRSFTSPSQRRGSLEQRVSEHYICTIIFKMYTYPTDMHWGAPPAFCHSSTLPKKEAGAGLDE